MYICDLCGHSTHPKQPKITRYHYRTVPNPGGRNPTRQEIAGEYKICHQCDSGVIRTPPNNRKIIVFRVGNPQTTQQEVVPKPPAYVPEGQRVVVDPIKLNRSILKKPGTLPLKNKKGIVARYQTSQQKSK